MIFRQLTSGGDWTFGKGLAGYAQDEAAVELNIRTRILSWVNDCFFAMQSGIDWRSRMDVGQEAALLDELKTTILQSFGVLGVSSVTLTRDALRQAIIQYNIDTIFGKSFTGLVATP